MIVLTPLPSPQLICHTLVFHFVDLCHLMSSYERFIETCANICLGSLYNCSASSVDSVPVITLSTKLFLRISNLSAMGKLYIF